MQDLFNVYFPTPFHLCFVFEFKELPTDSLLDPSVFLLQGSLLHQVIIFSTISDAVCMLLTPRH